MREADGVISGGPAYEVSGLKFGYGASRLATPQWV